MEVYRAIAAFKAPTRAGGRNVLSFERGDKFEILEGENTSKVWIAARSLRTSDVGYVPKNYVKFDERKVGKLLPEDYTAQREAHLRTLKEIQKQQDHGHPEHSFPNIPEPDYQKDDDSRVNGHSSVNHKPQGLIEPKKLHNPCLESKDRQDLHKELLYNNKMGIDVLNRKSELNKELDKRKEKRQQREQEEYLRSKRSSLEMQLEKQADKLKDYEHDGKSHSPVPEEEEKNKPEFFKIHARIRSVKLPSTSSEAAPNS